MCIHTGRNKLMLPTKRRVGTYAISESINQQSEFMRFKTASCNQRHNKTASRPMWTQLKLDKHHNCKTLLDLKKINLRKIFKNLEKY